MADRLHNMRTLGSQPLNKRYKIAGETLYIYAPLANRLGLNAIKSELEDLSFRYEHPQEYEDIANKLKDTEGELKEENENLQNELNEINNVHVNYVNNSEHEIEMLKQTILQNENKLKETKDTLSSEAEKNKQSLETLTESFNKERNELQMKIDTLGNDLNNKEKENASMQSKKEQLEKIIKDKETTIENLKDENQKEKDELNKKIEELKKNYNDLNDGSMMKNLEFTRDNALLKQQIEYLNNKNEETNKVIESNQKQYEQKLFALRSKVKKDFT
jgi:chromosome segregation ATPase